MKNNLIFFFLFLSFASFGQRFGDTYLKNAKDRAHEHLDQGNATLDSVQVFKDMFRTFLENKDRLLYEFVRDSFAGLPQRTTGFLVDTTTGDHQLFTWMSPSISQETEPSLSFYVDGISFHFFCEQGRTKTLSPLLIKVFVERDTNSFLLSGSYGAMASGDIHCNLLFIPDALRILEKFPSFRIVPHTKIISATRDAPELVYDLIDSTYTLNIDHPRSFSGITKKPECRNGICVHPDGRQVYFSQSGKFLNVPKGFEIFLELEGRGVTLVKRRYGFLNFNKHSGRKSIIRSYNTHGERIE